MSSCIAYTILINKIDVQYDIKVNPFPIFSHGYLSTVTALDSVHLGKHSNIYHNRGNQKVKRNDILVHLDSLSFVIFCWRAYFYPMDI